MSFQAPVWIHNKKAYNIKITTKQSYIFTSISEFQDTHKIPNTNNDEFQAVFSKIGERIVIITEEILINILIIPSIQTVKGI